MSGLNLGAMPQLKLRSYDGLIMTVDDRIAKFSPTIKYILEKNGNDPRRVILLRSVRAGILRKVVDWVGRHRDDLGADALQRRRGSWEPKYGRAGVLDTDVDLPYGDARTLVELTNAAHFLGIKGLMGATSYACAQLIDGKTTEEIMDTFNLEKIVKKIV